MIDSLSVRIEPGMKLGLIARMSWVAGLFGNLAACASDDGAFGGSADRSGAGGSVSSSDDGLATGGASAGGSGASASGGASGGSGTGGEPPVAPPPPTPDCEAIVSDPNVGWREGTLTTDQEIVECLWSTLGRPVGYGENANGGYDPAGGSELVIIDADASTSVEEQILAAISGDDPKWIVFDKDDFSEPTELSLHRVHCDDADVLSALGGTAAECRDHWAWCDGRGYTGEEECLDEFFNQALNDKDLPIRNPKIGSNKTIDGRMSEAYFRFSGFAIGGDSSGEPTQTAQSVILTHLSFVGAGHTEDHGLDPDMIRSTGASHDIWIHKNSFDTTGDSAFDVKVGAYDITISFNRVLDVKRASLHGSSDSREINANITTTMHHNAFVTKSGSYDDLGNTARRVPLIRRGTSHFWNNVFVNYRKDIFSVRVGATLLYESNAFVVDSSLQEKSSIQDSLDELAGNLIRDVDGGNFRTEDSVLWFSTADCVIDASTQTVLFNASGTVGDLSANYSSTSQALIDAQHLPSGQDLIDYVTATAGKGAQEPFLSPLGAPIDEVLAQSRTACQ